jgi:hypothetical protein
MGKSNTLQSSHIRFGKRTYFFDINQTPANTKYLRITESQFLGEGKERKYNSFILFPDDLESFQKSLTEAAAAVK